MLCAAAVPFSGNVICNVHPPTSSCPDFTAIYDPFTSYSAVSGQVAFQNSGITTMVNTHLTYLGSIFLTKSEASLTLIDLPVLTYVTQSFQVSSCTQLTLITAASLLTIGGNFQVQYNTALDNIDMPVLTSVLCHISACVGTSYAINLCGDNDATLAFSANIVTAAGGMACEYPILGSCNLVTC